MVERVIVLFSVSFFKICRIVVRKRVGALRPSDAKPLPFEPHLSLITALTQADSTLVSGKIRGG